MKIPADTAPSVRLLLRSYDESANAKICRYMGNLAARFALAAASVARQLWAWELEWARDAEASVRLAHELAIRERVRATGDPWHVARTKASRHVDYELARLEFPEPEPEAMREWCEEPDSEPPATVVLDAELERA